MPGEAYTVQDLIRQTAKRHGVPEALALAVAEHESSFNPEAVGPDIPSMPGVKAIGTFQLLPSTAKTLGVDPTDPAQNIEGGVKYLRQLLDASNGDLDLTLKTYGGFKQADPTAYITDISGRMAKFGVGASANDALQPPPVTTPDRTGASGRGSGAGPLATSQPRMTIEQVRATEAAAANAFDPVAIGKGLVKPFDPRTPQGRQNLAGLGGEIVASRIPGAKALTAIGPTIGPAAAATFRTVMPAIGAGVGAGTEAYIEQELGGRGIGDLITDEKPDSPLRVGVEQAAYSLGGQAVMWPVRRFGKLVLGSRIGKQAEAALKGKVASVREAGTRTVAALRDKVTDSLEAARIVERATQDAAKANLASKVAAATAKATEQTGQAEARATVRVEAARAQAAAKLAQQELDNVGLIQSATKEYDDLLGRPPSVAQGVAAQRAVLEGPAKRALELAGQRVDEAAASGPMVPVAKIKAQLQALIKQKRPDIIFNPPRPPLPEMASSSQALTEQIEAAQGALAQSLGLPPSHPLPGVVGKIMSIPTDQITFKEAHQIKRLLDEAVNWDRVAKKHLEAITKGTRTAIRDELSVHEPYNVATAAYHSLVPIYRKGIGKRLSAALMNNPDAAVRLLKDSDPIQAQTLKDLLVTQAAAGGDSKAGQMAWDMVRSHWAYNELIAGGADGLATRVRALMTEHPEFVKVIADDDAGKRVLQNLATLGDTITAAKTLAAERVAQTKAAGRAGVEAAKAAGTQDVAATKAAGQQGVADMRQAAANLLRQLRQQSSENLAQQAAGGRAQVRSVAERARQATAAAVAEQEKFQKSSVMRSSVSGQVADIMRAATLGTGSWFGNLSILRLINGPRGADLLEWAAYSDANTRRLTQALMGQVPDRVTSALLRDIGAALAPEGSGIVPPPATQPRPPARAAGAGPAGR